MRSKINVEVTYALPDRQMIVRLAVDAGATAAAAIEQSGIVDSFPEIAASNARIGVFGTLVKPDTILREGDRVEIYRPLIADPKEKRRKRAAQRKRGS
jgi:putative ubiquitin-RnfH superfamily antitoxin RatB of RatAB toxin-antitoxin module